MKEAETESSGGSDKPQESAGSVEPTVDGPVQRTEIAASIVRSSLAEMEIQTSSLLSRLEYLKGPGPVQKQMAQQQKQQEKQQSQKTTPPELPFKDVGLWQTKQSTRDIMAKFEKQLAALDVDGEQEFVMPPLDEASRLAVLQYSTGAYIGTREHSQIIRLVARLAGNTNDWLANMFNFAPCHTCYYREDAECTMQALRLALVHQQTENRTETRPVSSAAAIYLTDMVQLYVVQNACRYLGLPLSCIRVVPSLRADQSPDGIAGQMDIAVLERFMEADVAAGRLPLMLVATVGSTVTGLSDELGQLVSICASRRMWLHCQGLGLAALALTKSWPQKLPNSMTISLNSWLGLAGVPSVLVYHAPGGNSSTKGTTTLFDTDPILSNQIACLSVWTAMQALGADIIQERIFSAFDSCQELCKMLLQLEGIRVLSKPMFFDSSDAYRSNLINATNYEALAELAVPVVVFQFDGHTGTSSNTQGQTDDDRLGRALSGEESPEDHPTGDGTGVPPTVDTHTSQTETEPTAGDGVSQNHTNAQYYDRLNTWLGQNLLIDASQLRLEVIEHEQHGTAIRYCPFELGYGEQLPRPAETLASVASAIEAHVEIMRSTVRHRVRFQQLVAESGVLRLIELRDWAGLGGVHYVPEGWETLLTDQAKNELNKLNSALVEALQTTDGAFSHAESSEGLICVRFGMVTNETDVEELLELVVQTARVVQENSKILDTMSEILKKGIEAATIDLQREAEEKLWQEGILRQVPLVGRVVNWWSPPVRETGMKGRSLNLTQGVVESTENIYKYHMQMTPKTSNQLPGNKGPPAPLVQKPISTELADRQSVQHSRNASSSSELSGGGNAARRLSAAAVGAPSSSTSKPRSPVSPPVGSAVASHPTPTTPSGTNWTAEPLASSTPASASEET